MQIEIFLVMGIILAIILYSNKNELKKYFSQNFIDQSNYVILANYFNMILIFSKKKIIIFMY